MFIGDLMRVYYVFDVKEEFVSLYKDNANTLYNILNQMYYMKREDINYGYNLFKQIVNKQDKFKLDKYIFLLMHNKMKYAKKDNDHVINNLYKDEVSILKVKNTHILINSNKSYTEFFNILYDYNPNFFVCDFINHDYFFISNIKMLV